MIYENERKDKQYTKKNEVFAMKTGNEILTFKEKCISANVNYPNALYQRKKHPSLTDEEVIHICCNEKGVLDLTEVEKAKYYTDKKKPFMIKCKEEGLDYAMAYMYLRRHPDMTEDEVITFYRLKKSYKHITKDMTRGYLELKKKYPNLSDEELVAYCQVIMIHPTFSEDEIKRYFALRGVYPSKTDRELTAIMNDDT